MLVGLLFGLSHCEDTLSKNENMPESAVNHDDSNHDDHDYSVGKCY